MATGQTGIDAIRFALGETDATNSRWSDVQLLSYLNKGRREFAKLSQAVRALFQQTSKKDGTYRYAIPTGLLEILRVTWDGWDLDDHTFNRSEFVSGQTLTNVGRPYIYWRVGLSIDLYPAPNDEKTIEIEGTIITTDLALATAAETELLDDQLYAAVEYAAGQALNDDQRPNEAAIRFKEFARLCADWKRFAGSRGPRYTRITEGSESS